MSALLQERRLLPCSNPKRNQRWISRFTGRNSRRDLGCLLDLKVYERSFFVFTNSVLVEVLLRQYELYSYENPDNSREACMLGSLPHRGYSWLAWRTILFCPPLRIQVHLASDLPGYRPKRPLGN